MVPSVNLDTLAATWRMGITPPAGDLPLAATLHSDGARFHRHYDLFTQAVEIAYDTPWATLKELLEATKGSIYQFSVVGTHKGKAVIQELRRMPGMKKPPQDLKKNYPITYLVGDWTGRLFLPRAARPTQSRDPDVGFLVHRCHAEIERLLQAGADAKRREQEEAAAEVSRGAHNVSMESEDGFHTPHTAPTFASDDITMGHSSDVLEYSPKPIRPPKSPRGAKFDAGWGKEDEQGRPTPMSTPVSARDQPVVALTVLSPGTVAHHAAGQPTSRYQEAPAAHTPSDGNSDISDSEITDASLVAAAAAASYLCASEGDDAAGDYLPTD